MDDLVAHKMLLIYTDIIFQFKMYSLINKYLGNKNYNHQPQAKATSNPNSNLNHQQEKNKTSQKNISIDDAIPSLSMKPLDTVITNRKVRNVKINTTNNYKPSINTNISYLSYKNSSASNAIFEKVLFLDNKTKGSSFSSSALYLDCGMSIFYAYRNEKQIMQQSDIVPIEIQQIDIYDVMYHRKQKKPKNTQYANFLDQPITKFELQTIYKKSKLNSMLESSIIPGVTSTLCIANILVAVLINISFPFSILATISTLVILGFLCTIIATVNNYNRLNHAIENTFEQDDNAQETIDQLVADLNTQLTIEKQKISTLQGTEYAEKKHEIAKTYIIEGAKTNVTQKILNSTYQIRYTISILDLINSLWNIVHLLKLGIGNLVDLVSIVAIAVLNKKRRANIVSDKNKLINMLINPDYNNKKIKNLKLFGKTDFENFINKNLTDVKNTLAVDADLNFADTLKHLNRNKNKQVLCFYLESFAMETWNHQIQDITCTDINLEDLIDNDQQLNKLLIEYIIKKSGEYVTKDTIITAICACVSLFLVSLSILISFMPILITLAVASAILSLSLCISIAVTLKERASVMSKMNTIFHGQFDQQDIENLQQQQAAFSVLNDWKTKIVDHYKKPN